MAGRIADIRNPDLFQRLVRALYIAVRGDGFQVVDDAGGDRGNDGYDPGQGSLIAIYCPEGDTTRKRLLEKGRTDLGKAIKLRDSKQYQFTEWQFVTPHALPEQVQATLRGEAEAAGLRATFVSAEHLEALYLQYPHLRDLFPELDYPRVAGLVEEINGKVDALLAAQPGKAESATGEERVAKPAAEGPSAGEAYSVSLFPGFTSDALAAIQSKLDAGQPGARHELERYRLEAVRVLDRLAALMMEVEYEHEQLNFSTVARLAQDGARLAEGNAPAEAAVFKARLAFARQALLVEREHAMNGRLGIMARTGVPLVTEAQAEAYDREVPLEREAIRELFREAYREATGSRNLAAQLSVLLLYANGTTQSVFPGRLRVAAGIAQDQAGFERFAKRLIEDAYDLAILTARAMSSNQLTATAYSNFANDLRTFGDLDRALAHAEHALRLAVEVDDQRQVAKTTILIQKLKADIAGQGHERRA